MNGAVARLHPRFTNDLARKPDAAEDQRHADRVAEDRLRVAIEFASTPRDRDAGDRRRPRAGEQPEREMAVHRAEPAMPHRAERLEDRAVEDVGADGVRRLEAEDDDQDRRHQRAAADAGEADDQAEAEAGEGELPGHDKQTALGEQREHALGGVLDVERRHVEVEVRLLGRLVRRVDAGEVDELAGVCAFA